VAGSGDQHLGVRRLSLTLPADAPGDPEGARLIRNVGPLNIYQIESRVTAESPVYTIWRRPQSILLPRFVKVSMQFDF